MEAYNISHLETNTERKYESTGKWRDRGAERKAEGLQENVKEPENAGLSEKAAEGYNYELS